MFSPILMIPVFTLELLTNMPTYWWAFIFLLYSLLCCWFHAIFLLTHIFTMNGLSIELLPVPGCFLLCPLISILLIVSLGLRFNMKLHSVRQIVFLFQFPPLLTQQMKYASETRINNDGIDFYAGESNRLFWLCCNSVSGELTVSKIDGLICQLRFISLLLVGEGVAYHTQAVIKGLIKASAAKLIPACTWNTKQSWSPQACWNAIKTNSKQKSILATELHVILTLPSPAAPLAQLATWQDGNRQRRTIAKGKSLKTWLKWGGGGGEEEK